MKSFIYKSVSILFVAILVLPIFLFGYRGDDINVAQPIYSSFVQSDIFETGAKIELDAEQILKDFLDKNPDRTVGSDGEKQSANYLMAELQKLGYNVSLQTISGSVSSQNVIGTLRASRSGKKTVVIGADYGNFYASLMDASINAYTGALQNGTAVAAVLQVARELADVRSVKPIADFNVDIVFFGGSGFEGVTQYVQSLVSIDNILAMYNVARIGGDNMYLYTDEVYRSHRSIALRYDEIGLLDMPAGKVILPQIMSELPYSHYGLLDNHALFYKYGIPVNYIYGGNMSTMGLDNAERAGGANLGGTAFDNLTNLKETYPQSIANIQKVCDLIVDSLYDGDFVQTMTKSRQEAFSFAKAVDQTTMLVVSVVFVALVLVGFLTYMYFLRSKVSKYKTKKVKISVFGMQYEDKNSDNIFVDIERKNPFEK